MSWLLLYNLRLDFLALHKEIWKQQNKLILELVMMLKFMNFEKTFMKVNRGE